jgi:hypothetical protein
VRKELETKSQHTKRFFPLCCFVCLEGFLCLFEKFFSSLASSLKSPKQRTFMHNTHFNCVELSKIKFFRACQRENLAQKSFLLSVCFSAFLPFRHANEFLHSFSELGDGKGEEGGMVGRKVGRKIEWLADENRYKNYLL